MILLIGTHLRRKVQGNGYWMYNKITEKGMDIATILIAHYQ